MKQKISMMSLFQNPRYRGKHIIIADNKVYTAKTGEGASEILKKIRKNYPNIIPEIGFMPNHSLIL